MSPKVVQLVLVWFSLGVQHWGLIRDPWAAHVIWQRFNSTNKGVHFQKLEKYISHLSCQLSIEMAILEQNLQSKWEERKLDM